MRQIYTYFISDILFLSNKLIATSNH